MKGLIIFKKNSCLKAKGTNVKKTNSEFIQEAKEVHGNKYDYSKTKYNGAYNKIIVNCPIHGDFLIKPSYHLNKKGCAECGKITAKRKNTLTTKDFVEKAIKVHGNKYDYSKTKYIKDNIEVIITCPIHGDFIQIANYHKNGRGCSECGKENRSKNKRGTTKKFINKAIKIHGNKYDYSKTKYNGAHNKIIINCHDHGEFKQVANTHLSGSGCPKCKSSKGELKILKYLNKNKIKYKYQKKFRHLNMLYSFDFYLSDYNVIIEFDGIQHFEPINFSGTKNKNIVIENFNKQKERDNIKTN